MWAPRVAGVALLIVGCGGAYVVAAADAGDGAPPGDGAIATDAGPHDGTAPPRDADSARAEDASSPCTTGSHVFCDDFDRGPLGATWDPPAPDGGLLALVSQGCTSPPRCFEVRLQGYEAGARAELTRSVAFPSRGLAVSFDITVSGVSFASGAMGPLFVSMPGFPGTRFRHFNLAYSNAAIALVSANVSDDGGSVGDYRAAGVPKNERQRLTFRITAGGGKVVGSLSVDGNAGASLELTGPPPERLGLSIGAAYMTGAAGGTIRIDDVVVDAL